jgi:tRNA (guanine37-N1)-methyltransferase
VKFHALTIFPEFLKTVFEYGILRRAVEQGVISHNIRDLRDWTDDFHRTTDDAPYGGGPGMVMLCEPVFRAVNELRREFGNLPLIYLSPAGERFNHGTACELAEGGDFILLAGRYEGIDQRIVDQLVDRELSIGDYVLSGGEIPAMVVIDATARQLPGVIGNEESGAQESFATGLLDYPHYTRPESYGGSRVPDVLLSGHHARIEEWRRQQSLIETLKKRPELLTADQRDEAEELLGEEKTD